MLYMAVSESTVAQLVRSLAQMHNPSSILEYCEHVVCEVEHVAISIKIVIWLESLHIIKSTSKVE